MDSLCCAVHFELQVLFQRLSIDVSALFRHNAGGSRRAWWSTTRKSTPDEAVEERQASGKTGGRHTPEGGQLRQWYWPLDVHLETNRKFLHEPRRQCVASTLGQLSMDILRYWGPCRHDWLRSIQARHNFSFHVNVCPATPGLALLDLKVHLLIHLQAAVRRHKVPAIPPRGFNPSQSFHF